MVKSNENDKEPITYSYLLVPFVHVFICQNNLGEDVVISRSTPGNDWPALPKTMLGMLFSRELHCL